MLTKSVIVYIFPLTLMVWSECFLKEDHQAFMQNIEALNDHDEFVKSSNALQDSLGLTYCRCKDQEPLTPFCASLLELHYSRTRNTRKGSSTGEYKRGDRSFFFKYRKYLFIFPDLL